MLISIDTLKTYLSITDNTQDTILSIFANWASDYIETICWRKFQLDTYTELKNWAWQMDIVLENNPVKTITSVSYNSWTYENPIWTPIDKTAYNTDLKAWIVMLVWTLPRWFQNIQIIYEAWYENIPFDLQLAALKLAWMSYNKKWADWVTSESVWWDSISYSQAWMPDEVLSILSKYQNV